MKLSARSAALYSATFAGLLMLSACGKSEQPASTPPAASTAAAPAAPTPASTAPAPASTAAPTQAPAPSTTTAAAPVAAPASNTAAAPVAADLKVAGLTLGSAVSADHKVSKAKTTFTPGDKSIYASVATEGNTDGATLSAKWSYLEGKGQLVNSTSQSIATDGPATTTFRVQNPNNWPEGKYKVEIAVNGKSVATQNFEVKKG